MALPSTNDDDSNRTHYETCSLHPETTVGGTCYGRLQDGLICRAQTPVDTKEHRLPTCGRYSDQVIPYARCVAALPCGFACGGVFAWKPHGFRLCPRHADDESRPCLLLQLPPEVRRVIWGFVVVERPAVPHLLGKHPKPGNPQAPPTADTHPASRSLVGLLRTCRSIHDEAMEVMWAGNRFQIGVSMTKGSMSHGSVTAVSVAMCKGLSSLEVRSELRPWDERTTTESWAAGPPAGGRMRVDPQGAIQGFDLLRERLRREEVQRGHSHIQLRSIDPKVKLCRDLAFWTWEPPIAQQQFNKIRDVDLVLEVRGDRVWKHAEGPPVNQYIMKDLYRQVDILHKVVNRLQCLDHPLRSLSFEIRFLGWNDSMTTTFYLEMARFIMKPFMRLGVPAQLLSVRTAPKRFDEYTELSGETYDLFLRDWASNLNVDVEAYNKAVASFIQYYLLILSAIDGRGHRDECIDGELWNAIVRQTMLPAQAARESADVAALDRIRADVEACMCAMRAACARNGHPASPALQSAARAGEVVRVAVRPLPLPRPLHNHLGELGEPFAGLAARSRWPEGYSMLTRIPIVPPLLWLQTEYPAGKLPHMWAAGDLVLWDTSVPPREP